jgi:Zn finger protein HypA/HybF involved in hydrogenase expression
MCMTAYKLDVMNCSGCKAEWEYVRGEPQKLKCEACRLKNNYRYRTRTAEAVAKYLEGRRVKYETDETFRNKVGAYVLDRMKATTECPECEKVLKVGSMRYHKKACKGPNSKTTSQKILELSLIHAPLFESNDCDC